MKQPPWNKIFDGLLDFRESGMNNMKDCPCYEEKPDPCPMCGATVSGNDSVNGVCQAGTIRGERDELLAALKIAAQWMPLPHRAYTPDARRDAEIVQRALRLTSAKSEPAAK